MSLDSIFNRKHHPLSHLPFLSSPFSYIELFSSKILQYLLSYNIKSIKDAARLKLAKWFNEVEELGVDNFYTVIDTFGNHYQTILNFFVNRATKGLTRLSEFRFWLSRKEVWEIFLINIFFFPLYHGRKIFISVSRIRFTKRCLTLFLYC